VQTFVSIWWLKKPNEVIAAVTIGFEWLFLVLFVGVGFGMHTHPPREYYASPTPVRHYHTIPLCDSMLRIHLMVVLVLDCPGFQTRTPGWRVRLVLADIIHLYCLVLAAFLVASEIYHAR
jgi:hypothetical protein